ncbi:MAG: DUF1488 family protein [Planctomycetota bacterium]|nr:DUF1488 family protein [Planctomycetota bacterium]
MAESNIEFPTFGERWDADRKSLVFIAAFDGRRVAFVVDFSTFMGIFGESLGWTKPGMTGCMEACLTAFQKHKQAFHEAAEQCIEDDIDPKVDEVILTAIAV